AGTYEVRYIQAQGRKVLAREAITITAVDASVEIPATAAAGSTLTMACTGPDYSGDFISVARADVCGEADESYPYTREGSPLQLLRPAVAGTYEVRYIQKQKRKVMARETITITPVTASLQEVPATAAAGSRVTVAWTGPDYSGDYIS